MVSDEVIKQWIRQDHELRDRDESMDIGGNYQVLIQQAYALCHEIVQFQSQYYYLNSSRVFYHLKFDSTFYSLPSFIHQLMGEVLQMVHEMNQGVLINDDLKRHYEERLNQIHQSLKVIQDHYFDQERVQFIPHHFIYGHVRHDTCVFVEVHYPLLLDVQR